MSAVARTLDVARSQINKRRGRTVKPRSPYRKAEDAEFLAPIRAIVDARPTYGYRRVTALLNRRLRAECRPAVNAKRVLRIMQHHGLTLERHTAGGLAEPMTASSLRCARTCVRQRARTGGASLARCSDHLEIHARNREVVRILFVLDAFDREIIAWSAVAQSGISGEMVRDLMITAVERRFGTTKVQQPVEWLQDNSSAYIGQGHRRHGPCPRPDAALHARPQPGVERHVGSLR